MTITIEAFFAAIVAHTAALNANTAALGGAAPAADAAAASTTKAAGTKATTAKPKGPSKEEMVAVLGELKEKLGSDAAKAIIKEFGGVVKMAEIPDAKVKAVFDAATAKLSAPAAEPEPEEDGL